MAHSISKFDIHIHGELKEGKRNMKYIRLFKPSSAQLQAGLKKAKYIILRVINQSDISQSTHITLWSTNRNPTWDYITEQLRKGRYNRIPETREIILRNMSIPGAIITIPIKPSKIYSTVKGDFLKDKNDKPVIITSTCKFFTEEELKDNSYQQELNLLRLRVERYEVTNTKLD